MSELVGAPQVQMDAEDRLTASLLSVAYRDTEVVAKVRPINSMGSKTSRFWFKVESEAEFVAQQKVKFKPKVLEHVDDDVRERLKKFKKDLPPDLRTNISEIREFFLTELAPLTLATNGGATQAMQVVERLLDSKVDRTLTNKFEQMAQRASTIKLALFVLKLFNLPSEYYEALFPPKLQQPGSPGVGNFEAELHRILRQLSDLPTKRDLQKYGQTSKRGRTVQADTGP